MNQLRECLSRYGFCWRCIERFGQAEKNLAMFKVGTESLWHTDTTLCCGSCLGILHDKNIEKTVEMISTSLNKRNYESPDFSLAILLPQTLLLRQKASVILVRDVQAECGLKSEEIAGIHSVKDILKYVLGNAVQKITHKEASRRSELLVNVIYEYIEDDIEVGALESLLPNQQRGNSNKRNHINRHTKGHHRKLHPLNSTDSLKKVIDNLSDKELKKYLSVPPKDTAHGCSMRVDTCHGSLFLAGRYNKYSRKLSQTPWIVDGIRKSDSSVQVGLVKNGCGQSGYRTIKLMVSQECTDGELICDPIKEVVGSREEKFLSSGREDVDVKMLGRGRPFAIEFIDPSRTNLSQVDVAQLQCIVNNSTELVAIRDLQIINRKELLLLKQGEEEKMKSYSAVLWSPVNIEDEQIERLNSMQKFVLAQKTPLRVLHRRPLITREKLVHHVAISKVDAAHYLLQIVTQAGTYIKEFVHGDFGRTDPSLRTLIDAPIDIIELDVNCVELNWPPSIDHD